VKRGDYEFEWDPEKAHANFRKHGVAFTEAVTVFADPYAVDRVDLAHPGREVLIGYSEQERLLCTVYLEIHGNVIRIISARRASPSERRKYERHPK
jgi:uncharacterized DUF497 family protein